MAPRRPLFDRLPKGALPIIKEIARVVFRRPIAGIVAVARRSDGHILLVRRGDTGTWALPGGTLEWGEPARDTLRRELDEEAGATLLDTGRLIGVYTAPERDARVHGITMVVEARVADAIAGPHNPLEIFEARFFAPHEVPRPLAYTYEDMLDRALAADLTAYWE